MLGTSQTVAAVDEALDLLEPGTPIVIDPVMVAESGAVLLDDEARAALAELRIRAYRDHPEPPGGARPRAASRRGRRGPRQSAATASARRPSSSPAATATR